MIKRMLIMLAALALIAGVFAAWKVYSIKTGMKMMAASFAPPTVSTVKAAPQDWQPRLSAVGSLRAVNGADLSSEAAGIVEGLSFDSGDDVEKNALLVHLRDADEVAQLHALEATANINQINLQRDLRQLKAEAVSQATVDSDKATLANAQAQVAAQQAVIDKKTVRAPFAGRLGIRQVDLGQYLNPGATVVTLQQLDPIFVDFTLPEQDLPRLKAGLKTILTADAYTGEEFAGKLTALNSKIDDASRNITARAAFDNHDHKLLPGMFAHITVDSGTPQSFITLPQTAIVFNTYGNTVYVVDTKDGKATVQQSVVKTGETRGDQITILDGVKEGDEIVTSGQVKLCNGMQVNINNDNQPANDAHPTPQER